MGDAIEASFNWSGQHKHEFVAADGSWKATRPDYGPPEFDDSYANEEEVWRPAFLPGEKDGLGYRTPPKRSSIKHSRWCCICGGGGGEGTGASDRGGYSNGGGRVAVQE